MNIRPIASGSDGNAVLIEDGSSRLLLDCGLPWPWLRSAIGPRPIDGILLSHEHGDHACGAAEALRYGHTVAATPGTLAALRIGGIFGLAAQPLEQVQIGGWKARAVPVDHDGAREACAWLVASPSGKRAAYVTDAPYVHNLFGGVHYWLVEANYDSTILAQSGLEEAQLRHIVRGHMSIEAAMALLLANDIGRSREVWLLHLSDRHADAEAFRRRVMAATALPCHIAPSRAEAARARSPLAGGVLP